MTPTYILDMAHKVMGGIDLDPASSADANVNVRAAQYLERDGLSQPWCGRVWLNPPGGCLNPKTMLPAKTGISSAAVWWTKLVGAHALGSVTEALFLAFTLELFRTGQRFCEPPQAFPFCVPEDRIKFPSSCGKNVNQPAAASAIVYLGPNVQRFREVFGRLGYCT